MVPIIRENVVSCEGVLAEISSKLKNLGFICTCLVVLIHTPPGGGVVDRLVFQWVSSCWHGISMIAVPIFFVMSGMFVGAKTSQPDWYRKVVVSRIRTLVIPFLILNFLATVFFYAKHLLGLRYFGVTSSANVFSAYAVLDSLGLLPWGGGAVLGFWYIKVLFYLILASPLFVSIVRKGNFCTCLYFLILLLLWGLQMKYPISNPIYQRHLTLEFSFRSPLYFSIGLWLSLHMDLLLKRIKIGALLLLSGFSIVALIALFFMGNHDQLLRVFVMFLATISISIVIWSAVPNSCWPHFLVQNSFPVFATHGILLNILGCVSQRIPAFDNFGNGKMLFIFILTIVIGLLAAKVLKDQFPKFSAVIFGGR